MSFLQKKILIISNNVLSLSNNNGKTILSYIDCLDEKNVSQLFFSSEIPKIRLYNYFRISDKDILNNFLFGKVVGQPIKYYSENIINEKELFQKRISLKRRNFVLFLREILWHKRWHSANLDKWLEEVKPEVVFFVAGDCCFAYNICDYIVNKYNSRLTVYITDDYITENAIDSIKEKNRKKKIKKLLLQTLSLSSCFYTISDAMRKEYIASLGYDSKIAVNMTESLLLPNFKCNNDTIKLVYVGSLYYGRITILNQIGLSIQKYNKVAKTKKAFLEIYTNNIPSKKENNLINIDNGSAYLGHLDIETLKLKLNEADILVFVESFEEKYIAKTKYSLSTKIPEYLSLRKAIFAVGPLDVSSMQYLEGVAFTVNLLDNIDSKLEQVLTCQETRNIVAEKAYKKFLLYHNKDKNQKEFILNLLGNN